MDTLSLGAPRTTDQTVAFKSNSGFGTAAAWLFGVIFFEISERKELEKLRGEERGALCCCLWWGSEGSLRVQGSGFTLGAEGEIKR